MYLMSTVNAILFGEIVGGARGQRSAAVGYEMFDLWYLLRSILVDNSNTTI